MGQRAEPAGPVPAWYSTLVNLCGCVRVKFGVTVTLKCVHDVVPPHHEVLATAELADADLPFQVASGCRYLGSFIGDDAELKHKLDAWTHGQGPCWCC